MDALHGTRRLGAVTAGTVLIGLAGAGPAEAESSHCAPGDGLLTTIVGTLCNRLHGSPQPASGKPGTTKTEPAKGTPKKKRPSSKATGVLERPRKHRPPVGPHRGGIGPPPLSRPSVRMPMAPRPRLPAPPSPAPPDGVIAALPQVAPAPPAVQPRARLMSSGSDEGRDRWGDGLITGVLAGASGGITLGLLGGGLLRLRRRSW